ncbi:MAG: metal ABC transporter permease [Phycisphaerales bacterium JB040]
MNTLDYLTGPQAGVFWPGVVTALLVAALGALLSPLVVLKRLAFIGQGVSHAAFGGVGLGLALGLGGASLADEVALQAVVLVFSIGAALGIAWLSARPETKPDTAIGIVLAAAMALGFILYRVAGQRASEAGTRRPPALESVLFGDVISASWSDALFAGLVLALVALGLWWTRRRLVFWGFDEPASRAFGVPEGSTRTTLLVLLAVSVVVAVNLAGIVLATALFVLPGAIALARSTRLGWVWGWSVVSAVASALLGLVVSFEADLMPGPSVVLAMTGVFLLARLLPRGA